MHSATLKYFEDCRMKMKNPLRSRKLLQIVLYDMVMWRSLSAWGRYLYQDIRRRKALLEQIALVEKVLTIDGKSLKLKIVLATDAVRFY